MRKTRLNRNNWVEKMSEKRHKEKKDRVKERWKWRRKESVGGREGNKETKKRYIWEKEKGLQKERKKENKGSKE